mmetsp:Transcript_13201/g.37653  ORF Transcript_13201/g.37653 Transcript_13201/m.37653 type:complete len:86 (+) Transcript_13201:840-1097(+)
MSSRRCPAISTCETEAAALGTLGDVVFLLREDVRDAVACAKSWRDVFRDGGRDGGEDGIGDALCHLRISPDVSVSGLGGGAERLT